MRGVLIVLRICTCSSYKESYHITSITHLTHNSIEELLYHLDESRSKVGKRPLSNMGVNICTLESMVS